MQNDSTALCDWDGGERAILIKGCGGQDWAILVGRWTGFRRGQPGTMSRRGTPGSSGTLQLRLYCPVNKAPTHYRLPYDANKFEFSAKGFFINLRTGKIQVSARVLNYPNRFGTVWKNI